MVVDPSAMIDVFLASALLALLVHSAVSFSMSKFAPIALRPPQEPLRSSDADSMHDIQDVGARGIEASVTELRQSRLGVRDEALSNLNACGNEYARPSTDTKQSQSEVIGGNASKTLFASFLYDSERYFRVEPSSNALDQSGGVDPDASTGTDLTIA
jgi:hypothetical protein